jgi:hypothetical protein
MNLLKLLNVKFADLDKREALGYSTCEAPPKSLSSRLEEYGSVFNQLQ